MYPVSCPLRRPGISLVEVLAVVTILGILAALVVPRFSNHSAEGKRNGCFVNRGNIEVQCQLWLRQKGTAPQTNLGDIGANPAYFPEGIPTCPVDGSSYTINASTLRVVGHGH
jgi:prepilin-type N-terminal cleavage/methylation domain-containing protein